MPMIDTVSGSFFVEACAAGAGVLVGWDTTAGPLVGVAAGAAAAGADVAVGAEAGGAAPAAVGADGAVVGGAGVCAQAAIRGTATATIAAWRNPRRVTGWPMG